jgi:O-antigen ligase
MKNIVRRIRDGFASLCAYAYVVAQSYAVREPVRVRAWLTSGIVLVGSAVPALTVSDGTAGVLAAVALSALVVCVGESSRKRVSPTNE